MLCMDMDMYIDYHYDLYIMHAEDNQKIREYAITSICNSPDLELKAHEITQFGYNTGMRI